MEEIIVDGINVSGCIWLNETHPKSDFSGCGHVCDGHECAYKREYLIKQLKRKARKCEALEKITKELGCPTIATAKRLKLVIKDSQKENNKLKQVLQEIKDKTTKYNGCKSLGDYILQIISGVENE